MTPNHAERAHATWSASSAKRNMTCAGALALTQDLPETTSKPADWGTCAHQIADACLRDGTDSERFIGQTLKGKEHSFEVDEEMADTAQEFISYVRGLVEPGDDLWVEEKFSFASLRPPFDSGGTGDAVVYKPKEERLIVVDLKGGRGVVVEAKGNPQLRSYGLGAMLAHQGLAVQTVEVVIVQPRAPHPDGRIRSDVFTTAELLEWTLDMLAAMRRAKEAADAKPSGANDLALESWGEIWLSPGDHCRDTFCGAMGFCPAIKAEVERVVGLQFDPVTEAPVLRNSPDSGDPSERAKRLDALTMIEGWIAAVRAREHSLAEGGAPATGYCLVARVGRESFVDTVAAAKAALLAELAGVPSDKVYTPRKTRSPKQIRDAMKKSKADITGLAGLSARNSSGTDLVRETLTAREPVAPANAFEPVKENK